MAGAAVIAMVNGDEVSVSGVGVPESVTVNVMLLKVPAQDAMGAVPDVVAMMPEEFRVRHGGSEPLASVHL
jgi:hypothetical protein